MDHVADPPRPSSDPLPPGDLDDFLKHLLGDVVVNEGDTNPASKYLEIFGAFMKEMEKQSGALWGATNPALIATALTLAVIPSNTYIRVDCVPFHNNRWTVAFGKDLTKTAEILFNTHFLFDFIQPRKAHTFRSVKDISPFTRLAIYRKSNKSRKLFCICLCCGPSVLWRSISLS